MTVPLTAAEEKLILSMRAQAERTKNCKKCNGKGEIFSGYYGHPETDGRSGPVMYPCECRR